MSNITQVFPLFKVLLLSLLSGFTGAAFTVMPTMASTIKDIDFLGEVTFASDTQVEETLLGGLSGITTMLVKMFTIVFLTIAVKITPQDSIH